MLCKLYFEIILELILKSFDFQCDFDFQITTSKMILISKSSKYDDFAPTESRLHADKLTQLLTIIYAFLRYILDRIQICSSSADILCIFS